MGLWVPCLQEFVESSNDFSLKNASSFRQGAQNLPFISVRGRHVDLSLTVMRPSFGLSTSVICVFVSMKEK